MSHTIQLLGSIQLAVGTALFICLFWVESVNPFFRDRVRRIRHAGRNLFLGVLNIVVSSVAIVVAMAGVCLWVERNGIGLFNMLKIEGWLGVAIAILLLDLWMYVWHRLNHGNRILWRFHRMHHSDSEMDVSTALRFHPGETLISAAARAALAPVLGLELHHLLVYDAILLPVILFHHSNIALPKRFERLARALIVSPDIHRVHHSQSREEMNSNYASVFSFWDRLAGTLRLKDDVGSIRLGLKEFSSPYWQTVFAMMKTPFVSPRSDAKPYDGSVGLSRTEV